MKAEDATKCDRDLLRHAFRILIHLLRACTAGPYDGHMEQLAEAMIECD